jgi:hypothetical protein
MKDWINAIQQLLAKLPGSSNVKQSLSYSGKSKSKTKSWPVFGLPLKESMQRQREQVKYY